MKNTNNDQRKFNKQVNHLQSFIGMPHWNYRNPSLEEIREFDRHILEQQKKVFKPKGASLLKRVFSWVVKNLSKTNNNKGKSKTMRVIKKQKTKEPKNITPECYM